MNVPATPPFAPVRPDELSITPSPERPITLVASNTLTGSEAAEVRRALRDGRLGTYASELDWWRDCLPAGSSGSPAFDRARAAEQRELGEVA